MSEFCADIGYKSINHFGEQLCGDHVDVVEKGSDTIVVLADGLGSGVKASILSTLTSKIISTMLAEGPSLEECVTTIVKTLPARKEHNVAYSTFSILYIHDNKEIELIQYDNPLIIMLRNGKNYSYPKYEHPVEDKKIYRSTIKLHEGDVFIAMSDGCPNANNTLSYNYNWQREDIISFMETLVPVGYTAKTLATMLVDECDALYGGQPIDDVTSAVIRIRERHPVNILFGPPRDRDDNERMMHLFFGKEGQHIICGGTTASIAAKFLGKQVRATMKFESPEIPPISEIDGVDLVTEGVVTMNKVVTYAKDHLGENNMYSQWGFQRDGASLIARMIFEEATDVNFFVGQAINPAHQNPNLPNFNLKMTLVEELSTCLREMGKWVKVSYF